TNMTMSLVGNPAVTAEFLVNPNPSHGSTVVYSVNQAGMYEVIVEDGKSCGGSVIINVPVCQTVTLEVSQETVVAGGNVCAQVSVADFTNLVSVQFSLNWDPAIFTFDQVTNFNLPGLTGAQFGTPPNPPNILPGQLTVSWLDPSFLGTTVADGTVIFEICFDAIGMAGQSSDLSFTSDPTTIIVEDPLGNNLSVNPINQNITIIPPAVIPMISIVETPACSGLNNGQFVVTASGGTAPYNFIWQDTGGGPVNGPVNINMANGSASVGNLSPGTYSITLSDSAMPPGIVTGQANITAAPQLGANIVNPVQPTCNGDSNGSLSVEVLLDGVVVGSPGPDYSFNWSNAGNTQTISSIPSGPYAVTVTDANGCEAVASATLSQPAALTAADTTISSPNCPGDPNGLLAVIMQGGTMPYSYNWSNGATTAAAPLLMGDATYFVTVTDDRNCDAIFELFLPDPPAIIVPVPTNIQGVTCFDNTGTLCDGQATANASGGQNGSGLYNYIWSSGEVFNGVATSTAMTLCQGEQFVVVTDGVCAADTVFFQVGAPDPLEFDLAALEINQVSCFGSTDGSATVAALISSGTPPYEYEWSNLTTNMTVMGLAPGTYTVTLTDANSCQTSTSILIPEPDPIQVMVEPAGTSDISCNEESDGQITVSWMGGNAPGPATYTWSGNVAPPNSSVASNLDVGLYSVTVTDEKGCTGSTQHIVNEPPPIIVEIPTPEPPQCNGFQTVITIDTAYGGAAPNEPFFFSVDNGPQVLTTGAIPVLAGPHTITIIDNRDCQLDTMLIIDEPQEIVVDLGQDTIIELGEVLAIKPNIIFDPAVPIDTFIWSPTTNLACEVDTFCRNVFVSPLTTTTYTLTVFDENGCPGEDVIVVEVDKNRNVFIPNVFTPDGDGSNDFFSVFTGAGVEEVRFMQVYSRWGEKLYERNNFLPNNAGSDGWDGTFKGKTMNPGVYVYLIEVVFTDNVVLLYRGDVTVLH
ncbi:MAG: gliding motility-associated C-terminal domain-containing protein, partial [Saprospiraceae bacterium]